MSPSRPDGIETSPHGRLSRRTLIAGGASLAAAATLAGCTGGDGGGGTTTSPSQSEPQPPYDTDTLVDYIDGDETVGIYAAIGEVGTWEAFVEALNAEYDLSLTPNVYIGDAGQVSQRIIQERQADSDVVDVISQANDIADRIHTEGRDYMEQWYETGIDQDYWFTDAVEDFYTEPWYVSAYNGGVSTAMPINPDRFEALGLPVPETYNDLLGEEFAGLESLLPGYIVAYQVGWIITEHAPATDMDEETWTRTMMDHLSFSGISSHTNGARAVAEGRTPHMFYNFPNTVSQFVPETPLQPVFVENALMTTSHGRLAINAEAPNPWVARFVVSAAMEEPVQRRMVTDVGSQMIPGRMDLDYGPQNPGEFTVDRLTADVTPVTFAEQREFQQLGQTARSEWIEV